VSVVDMLRNGAKRFPERTCVIEFESGRRLTFGEASARADRLVGILRGLGVEPGARIALLSANTLEFYELATAAMRGGFVFVPLNFRLSEPELRFIVEDCTPRVLIHDAARSGMAEALGVEHTWSLDESAAASYHRLFDGEPPVAGPERPHAIDGRAIASLMYTSGTTGPPKGSMSTSANLQARFQGFAWEIPAYGADIVYLQTLPMYHVSSEFGYSFTYRGSTSVILREFDPAAVVAAVRAHRVTHVHMVPTTIGMLCASEAAADADFSSVRMVIYGGSKMPVPTLRAAVATLGCDFGNYYGMTETGLVAVLRPEDHDLDAKPHLLESIGSDALGVDVRIIDERGMECPAGAVGEITVGGPNVIDAYWNLRDDRRSLRDGWFHTGDAGYRDGEGRLFLVDRIKDIIITGGENVASVEVERVLQSHPAVAQVAVIGIPDERWGEAVHAVVVLKDGERPDEAELLGHCRAALAGYKVPKRVEYVDAMPMNAIGKILKRELRASRQG
jgi:acyl-CoA synthetase (AMP-forming)/AMP-acid ligase II